MSACASPKALFSPAVAAALLLGALAGCLGDRSDDEVEPEADTGTIRGHVVSEEGQPLGGATVRALLVDLNATADAEGGYVLENVPAGTVRIVASPPAAGFASQTRDVLVIGGKVNLVDFELRPLPTPTPRDRVLTFNGVIGCGLPAGTNCDPDAAQTTHHFPVETGLGGMIVEIRWTAALSGTSSILKAEVRAATPTACSVPFDSATGGSILKFVAEEGFPIHGGHNCVRVSLPPEGAALNQAYELAVSLFYYQPANPGYSGFD